jgi:hypothetical protein
MLSSRLISIMLISSFILTNFIPVQVFAQEPMAFGEIKPEGEVFILNSSGKWVELKNVYPLLKRTKLKTKDGTAFITTKEGSKIDILKETEAIITVVDTGYTVDILNCTGNLSFNIIPPVTLAVTTPETTLLYVQKAETPSPANIRGTVLNKDTGTEVKSIFGKIKVAQHSFQEKILDTGESLFVSGECVIAAVVPFPAPICFPACLFITGGAIAAYEGFRGEGVATPSGF